MRVGESTRKREVLMTHEWGEIANTVHEGREYIKKYTCAETETVFGDESEQIHIKGGGFKHPPTVGRFRMKVLISFGLILLASSIRCKDVKNVTRTPVVHTDCGPIQGAIKKTVWNGVEYSSFKGIPYARPPLGDLRFMPPVPPEPWKKTRDAIEEASQCPQVDDFDHYGGNEDCLYLSVFTPETKFNADMKLRPVMIWIYAGTFVWGYCNTTLYGPDFFEEQDVVVVSFNYRLGAMGFLFLNDSHAAGNAGLKDQVFAMEWVQRNIRAFGGDPQQVTIFGESAGGTSVSYHLLSERSKGLFNYTIAQSGSAASTTLYHTQQQALQSATNLAKDMGWTYSNTKELLQHYLEADVRELVLRTNNMSILVANVSAPFVPIRENPAVSDPDTIFLKECPITLFTTGNFTKVPSIMGWTHSEALVFTQPIYEFVNNTAKTWDQLLPFDRFNLSAAYQNVLDVSTLSSDVIFKGIIDYTQRLMTIHGNHPIYFYEFDYISNYSMHKEYFIPVLGNSHFDDVAFIFNAERLNAPTDPNDPFNQFRLMVVTMWANFAKTGNPTPPGSNPMGDVVWEPSGMEGKQLNISATPAMHPRLIDQLGLLDEYYSYAVLPITADCCNVTYLPYQKIFAAS